MEGTEGGRGDRIPAEIAYEKRLGNVKDGKARVNGGETGRERGREKEEKGRGERERKGGGRKDKRVDGDRVREKKLRMRGVWQNFQGITDPSLSKKQQISAGECCDQICILKIPPWLLWKARG